MANARVYQVKILVLIKKRKKRMWLYLEKYWSDNFVQISVIFSALSNDNKFVASFNCYFWPQKGAQPWTLDM